MSRLRWPTREVHHRSKWRMLVICLAGSWVALMARPAASQEASKAFVAWARENAIPIATTEPGQGFEDLQPLKEVVGNARVVGLGESVHGAHEFFEVRHRLLEFLVEELGFTAVAMETGFAEAVAINEYVLGRVEEPERWEYNWFTGSIGNRTELRALVRWMRQYNEDPRHARKLHFYGIDVQFGHSSPLAAIDGALAYLDQVDPEYAASSREALLPLVGQFLGSGGGVRGVSLAKYGDLPMEVRNAYTAAIADLVARFERQRVDYPRQSSEEAYEWAYRHAIVARQLDNGYRAVGSDKYYTQGGFDLPEQARTARDRSMAENVLWALEREGPEGRVLVLAHNGHLQKFPVDHIGEVHAKFTTLGLFLHSIRGDDYVSIGFAYGQGAENGWASYQTDASRPAKPGSLDAELARVGLPMFILDLRSVPKDSPAHEWLNQSWEQRESVPEYFLLNPLQAWDALFYIDEISPAQVEVAPN